MTSLSLLLAFVVAATVLTITPGVDTAMVLRSATVEGRRAAVFAALGILLGCLIWGAAVALGLGALLRASELAYTVVKFVGAGYLLWLGAKLVLRPRQTLDAGAGGMPTGKRGTGAFLQGFLTNMLNPKVGVFYVTFLPQFVPHSVSGSTGVAGYTFFLACLHVLLTVVWFAALIAAAAPLGRFLRRPGAVKTLDRLTGGVFVGFGVKLAVSSAR
ncbi:threonine/homoserine/homoserine lactone efflux protein [Novosphingobium sp. PhB165]|uniref:LysE family translocator n=1 Tax=Novosphingobium sp. PhB165 TaxID=2485105 RepID=UPI001046C92F|nr:LysE family translocator [Novosphingobium sp. PhB165]TCM19431.1 threonine/homoserine/homoserine lactone efflux protein [Novosphingobium sp. PhB165]